MAVKQGGFKKKRTHKTSKGVHGGGGKVSLTRLELALLGKGPTAATSRALFRNSMKGKG